MVARYDVLCYGAISIDVSGRVAHPWPAGGQAAATGYLLSAGGDAALVALTLAGLGLKVALAGGPVGDDPMGDYLQRTFEASGVDLYAGRQGKTSVTAVALEPSGRRSTLTFHEDTPLDKLPVPSSELIAGSRFLYACGCYGRNSVATGAIARENEVPSMLNLDPSAADGIGVFDIVVANEGISRQLSGDPIGAAETMRATGVGVAVVTLGDRGCVCLSDELLSVPAYRVKAIDTTGAGAAFAAGFIYARMQEFNVLDSLRIASAAGAYKCMSRGSYRQFSPKELFQFIDSIG